MSDKKETSVKLRDYDMAKIADVEQMTKVLRGQIVKHNLFTKIQGHNYVHVDGWAFAGGMLGILPRVVALTNLSKDLEVKWMAEVEIVDRSGKVISRGFAICSNKESKKKSFDEYAVMSMAQTRAIGKAYRNVLAWVMKLAGYETTPSEEMKKAGGDDLPTIQVDENPREKFDAAAKRMRAAKSIKGLEEVWISLPAVIRADDELVALGKELKKKLS